MLSQIISKRLKINKTKNISHNSCYNRKNIKTKKKNMCFSDCMVFKIRVGRSGFFFFFKPTSLLLPLKSHKLVCFFLTTAYQLFDMQYNVFGSKHRSNVQGNEENSVNIATVKRLLLNSETNTETETNFRILPIYFFFVIKNVRVGSKILGSVGRSETHIFFFWPKTNFVAF
jgi:hypothetical protein